MRDIGPLSTRRVDWLKGSHFASVSITGLSGDGGIDGRGVDQLGLVSFPVCFQCKRYQGSDGPRGLLKEYELGVRKEMVEAVETDAGFFGEIYPLLGRQMSMRQPYLYGKPAPLTGVCPVCNARVKVKHGTLWRHRRKPSKPAACTGSGTIPNPAA